jgi:hypothetical protein
VFEDWCLLGCYAVWFLQEPRGVTTQKTPFFIVTAVKTSNLTFKCVALAIAELHPTELTLHTPSECPKM